MSVNNVQFTDKEHNQEECIDRLQSHCFPDYTATSSAHNSKTYIMAENKNGLAMNSHSKGDTVRMSVPQFLHGIHINSVGPHLPWRSVAATFFGLSS